MIRATFVDLDGCLIDTKSGRRFPLHREDWRFNMPLVEFLNKYHKDNKIVIISNQLGITTGLISEKIFIEKMESICNKLELLLNRPKNDIVYGYCKEAGTYNTLPNPGLIYELALDFSLNLPKSTFIGNGDICKQTVQNSGIRMYIDSIDLII